MLARTKLYGAVVSVVAVAFLAVGQAAAVNWEGTSYTDHSALQAIGDDGNTTYTSGFPVRMIGIVINNNEDMLDPSPGFSNPAGWPPPPPPDLGGQAQIYIQAVNLDGTTWDPDTDSTFDDFGGTACWMGQNYGNLYPQDYGKNYSDDEWKAELGRLNLQGGTGVSDPIRAGDLVEIRANKGLYYQGKMNVNEQHNNDRDDEHPDWPDNRQDNPSPTDGSGDNDFEILRLDAGYGMPTPTEITLADLQADTGAAGYDPTYPMFDPSRQTGAEYYQGTLVRINDVKIDQHYEEEGWDNVWGADGKLMLTDENDENHLVCKLGLGDGFSAYGAPTGGVDGYFDVIGILDQESGDSNRDGYRIWVMDYSGNPEVLPEPATMLLLMCGSAVALGRSRRKHSG